MQQSFASSAGLRRKMVLGSSRRLFTLRAARMTYRPGTLADVPVAVAFLSSDEALFITSATLDVNGGLLAKARVLRVAERTTRNAAAGQAGARRE
jgi:NAD(P)-dependent dehydrogenase (short-subunit alcohol dehydrogenase family)